MEAIGEEYTGYEDGLKRSTQFGLKSLRLAKPLKSGMVLTVEPGIYFIPELISLWKSENKFKDFIHYDRIERVLPFGGIRIEDNVLVHGDRAQVLGPPIPKEIHEIEFLRSQAYQ
jgi:Xaa-Pro aminopeptidase